MSVVLLRGTFGAFSSHDMIDQQLPGGDFPGSMERTRRREGLHPTCIASTSLVNRESNEALREDARRCQAELATLRAALDAHQSLTAGLRARSSRNGARRLQHLLRRAEAKLVSGALRRWAGALPAPRDSCSIVDRRDPRLANTKSHPRGVPREHGVARTPSAAEGAPRLSPADRGVLELGRGAGNAKPQAGGEAYATPPRERGGAKDPPSGWSDEGDSWSLSSTAPGSSRGDTSPRPLRPQPSPEGDDLGCLPRGLTHVERAGAGPDALGIEREVEQSAKKGMGHDRRSCPAASKEGLTEAEAWAGAGAGGIEVEVGGEGEGPPAAGLPGAAVDVPRMMLALQLAVGEELYAAGERLFRCVEADHKELHGKLYRPLPLTSAERDQFHAVLEDTIRGPLGQHVVVFLRAQGSSRAVAIEKQRASLSGGRSGGRGWSGVGSRMEGQTDAGRGGAATSAGGLEVDEGDDDVDSLATGPSSSPAQKARAAR